MTPLLAALAFVPWAVVGCGAAEGTDPAPDPGATAAEADVRVVEEELADLVLHVSNQSFDDEVVRLTVAVDGNVIVDGDFHVEDQHNWVTFPLEMAPGGHEVTVDADSGASLRETFEVPGDKARYAVIDHWGEDDSAELTWLFQRRPVHFA